MKLSRRLWRRSSGRSVNSNCNPSVVPNVMAEKSAKEEKQVLRQVVKWQDLHFYRKSDVLYQLTCIFCQRFLPLCGDRTVDQMVQAARSCKQNIVEGSEDGATSTEMELKLLNVARASNAELREDYLDFIKRHHLVQWGSGHGRYQSLQDYTQRHNDLEDYVPHAEKWTAEEFANICLTLCYQVDAMMNHYLKRLEKEFVEQGGIKERMHAARTGYRLEQDAKQKRLEAENAALKAENAKLQADNEAFKALVAQWQARYEDLRSRALAAYYRQKEEIERLKQTLNDKGDI